MQILRRISGLTLNGQIPSSTIRNRCDMQDTVRQIQKRRRTWNRHVSRMGDHPAKVVRDAKPDREHRRGGSQTPRRQPVKQATGLIKIEENKEEYVM